MINLTLQEQLHNLLNCDIKSLYPLARNLNRKLYFYVGATNSGKTYQAMQKLKLAHTGIYLAPLRLLALENYENLISSNIKTSLITGEEEIFDEDAAHICSTIEMCNFEIDIDVAVIDEVQMLDDVDRGWAWVNAIIGVPSREVIMTGSVNTLKAIQIIAKYLNEELEIVKFDRINPLKIISQYTPIKKIQPKTALIAFSRKNVLTLKSRLSKYYNISVLYGNLSPEVRKEEARRFRDGQSDILIATDAIAMGLNLPIQTILFTTDTKFDGIRRRKLIVNEIIQIAGRAGRYGHHEVGYIGATSRSVLKHISKEFYKPLKTIKPPFYVKATTTQIVDIAKHIKTKSLTKVLKYFFKNMKFDGPFQAVNISTMIELAKILDTKHNLKLEDKFLLSQAPVSIKSMLIKNAYYFYINSILKNKVVVYKPSISIKKVAKSSKELLQAEDELKKISLYLWLSYKLPNLFPSKDKATIARDSINRYCQKSLKSRIDII